MRCRVFRTPGGATGVICGTFKPTPNCQACGTAGATIQCDWKLTGGKKGATCDRWLCAACSTTVGDDKDLCPPHATMWSRHPANPKNKVSAP